MKSYAKNACDKNIMLEWKVTLKMHGIEINVLA